MPHYLYHSEAFIIGSRPVGEGSRLLDLITERLGRVPVLAQGSRELRSKLRYQLIDLNFFQATLVRGREFWRLVGAEAPTDLNVAQLMTDYNHRMLVARLALLLRRFLPENEVSSDRRLYAEIRSAISFLIQHQLSDHEREQYEIATVWRLLSRLGYGRRTKTLEAILIPEDWSHDLLTATAACQPEAIASINEALYHSHL